MTDRLLNVPELPTNDDGLPINDDRLPINDDRLPINDDRLPINDDRLPINDDRLPSAMIAKHASTHKLLNYQRFRQKLGVLHPTSHTSARPWHLVPSNICVES